MSDTTPNTAEEPGAPVPAPTEGAAPAAVNPPTYSAPTSETAQQPAPPAAPPAQPQQTWTAPTPVTGREKTHDARRGGVMGGIILIVVGVIFLASEFVPGIDVGKLWPLILVAIGIGIIFRRR